MQSVFGAIQAFDRLDLLRDVPAEWSLDQTGPCVGRQQSLREITDLHSMHRLPAALRADRGRPAAGA